MQLTSTRQQRPLPAWKSPWVIAWIALVVVVLGVNFTMVYLAVATNPGLVVDDFYERGQHYERTMFSKKAGDLGWQLQTDFPEEIYAGVPTSIHFFLVNKAGEPVTPESVQLFLYRPSDVARDFMVAMTEEGPGRYVADVSFPLIGVWDSLVAVRNGDDEYHVGKRIEVKHP